MPIILAFVYALRRLRFDRQSLLIALAAVVLCYTHFYCTKITDFAIDIGYHTDYVQSIEKNWQTPPPDYTNAEFRHPPLYYWLGALTEGAARATGMDDPMRAVRHVSMALYLLFCVFGMRMLRDYLPADSRAYHTSLALLLFWPLGATMSARVTCDVMLYATQMGAIFYWARWFEWRDKAALPWVFVWSGLTILSKDIGLMFIALAFATLLDAAWQQQWKLRTLFTRKLVAGMLFALLCAYITLHRTWFFRHVHDMPNPLGPNPHEFWAWVRIFTVFNPVLYFDETILNVHQNDSQMLFWHWFMRSILFGDFIEWKALSVIFVGGIVWVCMVLFMLSGLLLIRRLSRGEERLFAFLVFLSGLMIGAMMLMRYRTLNPAYADARYFYPLVPILLLYYGKVMEWHRKAGNQLMVQVGSGLGVGMLLVSVMLYIAQYFLLSRIEGTHPL